MTYLPRNARSELILPSNAAGGGVLETTRRFQIASPASYLPGLSPTRGSDAGAVAGPVRALVVLAHALAVMRASEMQMLWIARERSVREIIECVVEDTRRWCSVCVRFN